MSRSLEELFDRLGRGGDTTAVLAELSDRAQEAIPFLCTMIESGRAVFVASALLGKLDVPDRVAMLAPLASDPRRSVRSEAIRQLGATGDRRAIAVLEHAAEQETSLGPYIRALGELGHQDALPPVRAMIAKQLSDIAQPQTLDALVHQAVADQDPSELYVAAWSAESLAKLGDFALVDTACRLARFVPERDPELDAVSVRLYAIHALDISVGPRVAAVLAESLRDTDPQVAEAAATAERRLGRMRAVEHWLDAFEQPDGTLPPVAHNRIYELVGRRPPDDANEARAWWKKRASRYDPDLCYESGVPASPVRFVLDAHRPDSAIARIELRHMTGLPFVESTLTPPPASELKALDDWWKAHADDFPPGKLHRWGRTYEPDACG